jgi:hypothetical protein
LITLVKLHGYQFGKVTAAGCSEVSRMGMMVKKPAQADIPLEAVQSLLTRVIWQAVADLSVPAFKGEAEMFFAGAAFEEYCDILGWNVRRARASLNRFVGSGARISGNHMLPAGSSQSLPAVAS